LLQVPLHRDKKAPEHLKMYHGQGVGLFRHVKLLLQTFGARVAPLLSVTCDWDAQVTRSALGALIPSNARRELNLPPSPGSQGPRRVFTTVWAEHADVRVGYGFESRNNGPEYLGRIAFQRPRSPLEPADFEPDRFRAYRVTQASDPYAIERISTRKDAILISNLGVTERKLSVSFIAVESFIAEPLARTLIERLLLGELLADDLKGRYDVVEYVASELGSTTTVRVAK